MAKKLLETNLGEGGSTAFIRKGQELKDISRLPEILSISCNPCVTQDEGGVVVYFSKEEYQKLKKEYHIQE